GDWPDLGPRPCRARGAAPRSAAAPSGLPRLGVHALRRPGGGAVHARSGSGERGIRPAACAATPVRADALAALGPGRLCDPAGNTSTPRSGGLALALSLVADFRRETSRGDRRPSPGTRCAIRERRVDSNADRFDDRLTGGASFAPVCAHPALGNPGSGEGA